MKAFHAFKFKRVCAHLVEKPQVRAFPDQIIVHRAKHRSEAVRVGDSPFGIASQCAVSQRLSRGQCNGTFEETGRVTTGQFPDDVTVNSKCRNGLRAGNEAACNETVSDLMHAENCKWI
ncbi:hypothetical protein D3C80_1519180 [compost metagenome]